MVKTCSKRSNGQGSDEMVTTIQLLSEVQKEKVLLIDLTPFILIT